MNFGKTSVTMALSALLFIQSCSTHEQENTLLPEVAEIVLNTPQPVPPNLKQDVFVALLTLDAPESADYINIGSQVVQTNFEAHKRSIQTQTPREASDSPARHYGNKETLDFNLNINGDDYSFPCAEPEASECASKTLTDKKTIATLVHNSNSVLITRYHRLKQLPEYGSYYYGAEDPLPNYGVLMRLSHLQVAQAIIAFGKGDGDTGFALLSAEMAFARRMLNQDETLIGKMIAITLLNSQITAISSLLDLPQMHAYLNDHRLQDLFTPLTEAEQKTMAGALTFERNVHLFLLYTHVVDNKALYNRYATTNTEYLRRQADIQRASLTMAETSNLYIQGKLPPLDEEVALLVEQFPLSNDNSVGKVMIDSDRPSFEPYIQRLYDLQSHIALAQIKYQIVQAAIPVKTIPAFLQKQSEQAKNPLTRQLFEWDTQTHMLSTPRQEQNKRAGERIMVWIKAKG